MHGQGEGETGDDSDEEVDDEVAVGGRLLPVGRAGAEGCGEMARAVFVSTCMHAAAVTGVAQFVLAGAKMENTMKTAVARAGVEGRGQGWRWQ